MSQTRFQSRVGGFVVLCLVLMAALLLVFSKGTRFFTPTYEVKMRIRNVGGLKERSAVFLAGIQIGNLKSVELAPDGRSVVLRLTVLRKYQVHKDAEFVVEQIGVLGDQFVSIHPRENTAPLLQDGDVVEGRESFNFQEVARSADDLLKQFSRALVEIRESITNVKASVLDPTTLSNFSATVANFRKVSEHTLVMVQDASALVRTNGQPLTQAVSNMVSFSARLEKVAEHLDETIITNRAGISGAVTNFQIATGALRDLATDLNAGKGLAGSLLKDQHLQSQVAEFTSNLVVLSSNLNRHGLLYKPRPPKPTTTAPNLYRGKSPF